MSARLITRCPQCKRITSDCTDLEATVDREEFNKCRCRKCVATTHPDGRPKKQPARGHAGVHLAYWQRSKKGYARSFSKFAGVCGIK